jgi:Transglutaminase-like superfamily
MKNSFLLVVLFFGFGFSQVKNEYAKIDLKMSKIPQELTQSTASIAQYISENFKSDSDKIRAVFFWTASNISYDVDKLKLIIANPKERTLETSEDKIKTALSSQKGVCIHYAEVFNAIANQVNLKTVIVEGYTKQNGKVDVISHAWCASKIDEKWFIFDPTWGAGSVNNSNFTKKLNNAFFKTNPSVSIISHMPFDYLWQFLNYPISNQEFYDGKTAVDATKENFDFNSEIETNEKLTDSEKAIKSAIRIEKGGLKNDLIKQAFSDKKLKQTFESLTKITNDYNEAILFFNDFVNFRNNQFKPNIPDEDLLGLIQKPKNIFMDCQNRVYKLGAVDEQNVQNLRNLKKSMIEVIKQAEEHESFVKEYLGKGKLKRKMMFKKITFFGIPVN